MTEQTHCELCGDLIDDALESHIDQFICDECLDDVDDYWETQQ